MFTPEIMDDTYMNIEVALSRDTEGPEFSRVTKRVKDANGLPIVTSNENLILDTRMYEVKYIDGHKASLTANTIAKNMFSQVNNEGNIHVLFNKMIDHRSTVLALKQDDAFIVASSGNR